MFDMHTVRLLKHLWTTVYAKDYPSFQALFGGMTSAGNWDDILREWWETLSREDYILFRTGFNLSAKRFPQVIVTLEEEPNESQPLGFDGGLQTDPAGNLETVYTMILEQTAVIRIFADTGEHVRALHEFVRQAMMSNVAFFGQLGYQGLQYLSGSDLEPEAEAMPELLGVMVRSQRWKTIYEPRVAAPAVLGKSLFVHANDVTIETVQGGVSGTTEDI
jgi:hypothetical protein